ITGGLGTPCTSSAQAGLNLGTSANFVVLAGAAVTSTGNTEVTGDLGVWAGGAVTGFAGIVPGGLGIVHGSVHAGAATAEMAQGRTDLPPRSLPPRISKDPSWPTNPSRLPRVRRSQAALWRASPPSPWMTTQLQFLLRKSCEQIQNTNKKHYGKKKQRRTNDG